MGSSELLNKRAARGHLCYYISDNTVQLVTHFCSEIENQHEMEEFGDGNAIQNLLESDSGINGSDNDRAILDQFESFIKQSDLTGPTSPMSTPGRLLNTCVYKF